MQNCACGNYLNWVCCGGVRERQSGRRGAGGGGAGDDRDVRRDIWMICASRTFNFEMAHLWPLPGAIQNRFTGHIDPVDAVEEAVRRGPANWIPWRCQANSSDIEGQRSVGTVLVGLASGGVEEVAGGGTGFFETTRIGKKILSRFVAHDSPAVTGLVKIAR